MGSRYHCDGAAEEDRLEQGDMYVDLGEGPAEEQQAELSNRVGEAWSDGITEQGAKCRSKLLNKYQEVSNKPWKKPSSQFSTYKSPFETKLESRTVKTSALLSRSKGTLRSISGEAVGTRFCRRNTECLSAGGSTIGSEEGI